jgi:hypothetical protein
VTRSARRPVLATFGLVIAGVLAACSSAAPATPAASPSAVPDRTLVPTGPSTAPATPGQGNVDGQNPELTVELSDGYLVAVTDPEAKAWRIEVRGRGLAANDRLDLIVEVGDTAPGAEARMYVRGGLVDVLPLGSLIDNETAAAGGCHPTLDVCFSSGTISVDPVGGTVTALLEALDGGGVEIRGSSAGWPEEPFVLGPWRTSEPFVAE